jgi:hypothetical protein
MAAAEPFQPFHPWIADLVDEVRPDVFVAIARGALRLLQVTDGIEAVRGSALISQYALPFLRDEDLTGRRVLLFDDSTIFGSTMSRTRDRLRRRGAIVACASYIVDRHHFLGEPVHSGARAFAPHAGLPVTYKYRLPAAAVRRHHAALVEAVLGTPLNYNLDYPSYRIATNGLTKADIPFLVAGLESVPGFDSVSDVSTDASTSRHVYRYSVFLGPERYPFALPQGVYWLPHCKLRVTFAPRHQEIRISSIVQIGIDHSLRFRDVAFEDPHLESVWRSLAAPADETPEEYMPALARLVAAVVAMHVAAHCLEDVCDLWRQEVQLEKPELAEDELGYAFGRSNRETLAGAWAGGFPGTGLGEGAPLETRRQIEMAGGEDLRRELLRLWEADGRLAPKGSELVTEQVGKLFVGLRQITDSDEHRKTNPTASRLDVGLTFDAMSAVLESGLGAPISESALSLGMDFCVDHGLAVPKLISNDTGWFRAFYCGEDEDDQATFQFKSAIYEAYSAHLDARRKALTPFDFHKLCTTLKELLGWLPVTAGYNVYGRFGTVGHDQTELIEWLTKDGPLLLGEVAGRQVLLPDRGYHSPVRRSWPPDRARNFFDAFDYLASAFCVLGDEAKLLVSTCRTHRHTYNAVAHEAHSWCGHGTRGFGGFLKAGLDMNDSGDSSAMLSGLYWCIRYVSEAQKKYAIFHERFDAIANKWDRYFLRRVRGAHHWWQFARQSGLLDPSHDPEIAYRFGVLMPLLGQMMRVTGFVAGALVSHGLLDEDQLGQTFQRNHARLRVSDNMWLKLDRPDVYASAYNRALRDRGVPGTSILVTSLPTGTLGRGGAGWTLDAVAAVHQELYEALRMFCRRYRVAPGEFPYSPDASRILLEDGGVERQVDGMYVLTVELIKSTDSVEAQRCKESIRTILLQSGERGVAYEETRNDCFVACARDPKVLWDIAGAITIEGLALITPGGKFGGTRKAISFGSVSLVRKPDGKTLIGDWRVPHLLPRAFGLLDGIRLLDGQEAQNLSIVLSPEAAAEGAEALGLREADLVEIQLQSKHYQGKALVARLPGWRLSDPRGT